jgi:PadR family transcriptional regulator, regulatory protein PadR
MSIEGTQLETHLRELRRGSVLLVCLLLLRSPDYGYGLLERLQAAGVDVDANTLYPLLRRLEAQGLLTSEWDTDGARPRKYYVTNADGLALARQLKAAWLEMTRTLEGLDRGDQK